MPNWCENVVNLRHDNPSMVKAAIEAAREGKLLEFAVPMPADLRREGVESYGGEDAAKNDALRAENLAKHGYKSWYDWSVEHWGTKWDVEVEVEVEMDKICRLRFDSAWSPPIPVYRALERQGFLVHALFVEYGVDFAGVYTGGAESSYDSCEEALLSPWRYELDDTFGISGVIAQLESEE